jgi:hypothetical protein
MRRPSIVLGLVLAVASVTLSATAATAAEATRGAPPTEAAPAAPQVTVGPGGSIQAAVNHAAPGDVIYVKPGVYHESVLVRTNGLKIIGSGASASGTVLVPPTEPQKRCLHGGAGFCVFGHPGSTGPVPVRNVSISGFVVRGFPAFGVVTFRAVDTLVRHIRASHDGEYGITSFNSRGSQFMYNTTAYDGEAGLYFGDSPHAHALIVGNRSFGSGEGLLLRDSAIGAVHDNNLFRNCAGIAIVDTPAPTRPHDYVVSRNQIWHNNRFCEGEQGGPPPHSGTGIAVIGGKDNRVAGNTVWSNRPSKAGAAFPGGIVLLSAKSLGGAVETGNHIVGNRAYRNRPADLVWDGKGAGNVFLRNKCARSTPPGLCH